MSKETPKYSFTDAESKPSRSHKSPSKYLPMLNQFIEATYNEATKEIDAKPKILRVTGKTANYMRTQLMKIIENDNLPVEASVINNELYLSRTDAPIVELE